MERTTDANEMAKGADVDPKSFRAALRKANLSWHPTKHQRWTVRVGSPEHDDMIRILKTVRRRGN